MREESESLLTAVDSVITSRGSALMQPTGNHCLSYAKIFFCHHNNGFVFDGYLNFKLPDQVSTGK